MPIDLIFNTALFSNISADERENFIKNLDFSVKKIKKNEHIAHQGDKINHLHILTKGKVKAEMVSAVGLVLFIEELVAPYPLAAAFLFTHKNTFPVNILATEDSEIVSITKSSIETLLLSNLSFLRNFLTFNSNRAHFLSERLRIFSQRSIKSKLAYYILVNATSMEFKFSTTISALSEYFGVTRPSLSRAISELEKDGILSYKSGLWKILDAHKLDDMIQ